MKYLAKVFTMLCLTAISLSASGQASVDELVTRGQELFHSDIGCKICHADTGEGLVGPSILFGPTPVDIFDQLESNPVMGVIVDKMNPTDEDLAAISKRVWPSNGWLDLLR
jgi:mono/diheme cytochrome c family protein